MTIPNPDHFFEQAKQLIKPPAKGAPRQVDLRRAISAAYYGVFHFVLRAVADEFVGKGQQGSQAYVLAYRSLDHGKFNKVCQELKKPSPSALYQKYVPGGGFSQPVREFAHSALELQEKRHSADYDPSIRFRMLDAAAVVAAAEIAISRFRSADPNEQRTVLALLVFTAR